MAARLFASKRQRKPLLIYRLLSHVALDNLINLPMSPLKEPRVACLPFGKALCLLALWFSHLILPWSLILLARYRPTHGRSLIYMALVRVTRVLRLPIGFIIWIYPAHRTGS